MNKSDTAIPKGWERMQIKDLLDYERPDKYIVEDDKYISDGTPVLTANKSFILGYTDEKSGIYQNLPVIVFDDFTTDSKFVDFPFKIKSSAIKLLKNKEGVNLRFVYEKMKSVNFPTGSHKRFYISQYQNMEVLVPPVNEQEKIAEILASVDEEIQKTDEITAATEKLKKGLMRQLFTRGIGHAKFKKTALGSIPEEWGMVRYGDVTKITTGKKDANAQVRDGVYPFFTCAQRISHIDKYSFDTEAVLVAGNGDFNVKYYKGKFDAYQRTYVIEGKESLNTRFLYFLTLYALPQITSGARGSTIQYLKMGDFTDFKFGLPAIEEQNKIVQILEAADEKLLVNKKLYSRLHSLKKGLMQDLLSGRKRTI